MTQQPAEGVDPHLLGLDTEHGPRRREPEQRAARLIAPWRLADLGRIDVEQAEDGDALDRRREPQRVAVGNR